MKRRKRLSWIPNLFTLGNLSLGFFAIILASYSRQDPDVLTLSGALIILALFCDGLDGYAARLFQAKSDLGAQLDSLADMATFGIAPGILMYSLVLHQSNYQLTPALSIPTGMLIAAIFPACTAYRLARFNVDGITDRFKGLPSPVAGVIVALMPLSFRENIPISSAVLGAIFILTAFLMVSTVHYAKPQFAYLRRFSPVRLALLGAFLVSCLVFTLSRYGIEYAAAGLFTFVIIYVVSGIVSFIIHTIQEYRM